MAINDNTSYFINFYPRPPRGGRLDGSRKTLRICTISIHALREEGDAEEGNVSPHFKISIHALREEGDHYCTNERKRTSYFYPRPPRGGRQRMALKKILTTKFLSTPSARRATAKTEKNISAFVSL